MSEKLKWPKEPNLPDRPGWWWVKTDDGQEYITEIWCPSQIKGELYVGGCPVNAWKQRRWAGPIAKPEEA